MEKAAEKPEESIEELRQRLNAMKKMIAERQMMSDDPSNQDRRKSSSGVIDGSFLSVVFGLALLVILSVSVYAFYNLYIAILKKFQVRHDEL